MCTGDVLLGLLQSFFDVVGPLQEHLDLLLGILLLSSRGFVLVLLTVVLFLFLLIVIILFIVLVAGGLVLGLLAREGLLGLVLGQQLFGGLGLGIERFDLGYRSDSPQTAARGAHERQSARQQDVERGTGEGWIMGHQPANLGGPSRSAASGQGRP